MTWVLPSPPHLAVWLALACVRMVASSSLLNSTLGQLQGFEARVKHSGHNEKVNVFYGVPFAKPPVGKLRFKHPVPAEPWSGSRDATKLPPSCWQTLDTSHGDFHGATMWNPNTEMSEDCLYLNVWQPVGGAKPKPVLVWIFGGGFFAGSSTLDVYNATALAGMNDVIVVSMNYRVNVLGFLYTGTQDAPGNAGLMDQQMALQWVYDNADRLGGDRSRITIFGESAGAASVGLHLLSPGSRDLFTYAVMMSAAPSAWWAVQNQPHAMSRAKQLATSLGCSTASTREMMRCLHDSQPGASNWTLVENQWKVAKGVEFFDLLAFGPVVDGTFLNDTPYNLLMKGQVKQASLITGVVQDEGSFWIKYFDKKVFNDTKVLDITPTVFSDMARKLIAPMMRALACPSQRAQDFVHTMTTHLYWEGVPPGQRSTYADALDDISGDIVFKCGVLNFTKEYAARHPGSQVFLYNFNYRLSNVEWDDWMGVIHGYEIEAFFGIPFINDSYTELDRKVSRKVMGFLSQFSRTGVPDASWPAYSSDSQHYLEIQGDPLTTRMQDLRHRECDFWDHEVPSLLSLGPACDEVNQAVVTSTMSTVLTVSSAAVAWLYRTLATL